jgi:hypothetical protein
MKKSQNETKWIVSALGAVAFVLVAVSANDTILKFQKPIYVVSDNMDASSLKLLNRVVASSDNVNLTQDIEWEHRLADKLAIANVNDRQPASYSNKPTTLDQIRIGVLAGKYRVNSTKEEKISDIDYVSSASLEEQPSSFDREQFLQKYSESFVVNYSQVELEKNTGDSEIYKLKDRTNRVLGLAHVTLDDRGRVLSLRVSEVPELAR